MFANFSSAFDNLFSLFVVVGSVLELFENFILCYFLGMVFNLTLGFTNLKNTETKDDANKTYALFLGETVVVNENATVVVTTSKKQMKNIGMFLKVSTFFLHNKVCTFPGPHLTDIKMRVSLKNKCPALLFLIKF